MRNELIGYLREPTNSFDSLPKSNKSTFVLVNLKHTKPSNNIFSALVYMWGEQISWELGRMFRKRNSSLAQWNLLKTKVFWISLRSTWNERLEKRNTRMRTVLFGDDLSYLEMLINETIVLKNGRRKVSILLIWKIYNYFRFLKMKRISQKTRHRIVFSTHDITVTWSYSQVFKNYP